MRKPDGQIVFLGSVILAGLVLLGYVTLFHSNGRAGNRSTSTSDPQLARIPFGGERAYRFLEAICQLGPRPSGSDAMARQQKMLSDHFAGLGGEVEFNSWQEKWD